MVRTDALDTPDPEVNTYVVTLLDAQEGDNFVNARVPEDRGHSVPVLRFVRKGTDTVKKVLSVEARMTPRQASHLYGFEVVLKEETSKKITGKSTKGSNTSTTSNASNSDTTTDTKE